MRKWILNHPANFFLIAAVFAIVVLWLLDIFDNNFSWHDILVEAHGMFYDLLVFGILLALYEQFKNKKDTIKRYKEELDDYRGWTEGEAAYRVAGIIRRLKNNGVKEIDFSNLHLGELDTNSIVEQIKNEIQIGSLEGVNLKGANLPDVYLMGINMQHSNLENINLKEASLTTSNLNRANLKNADLREAYLWSTDLEHADLSGADLRQAEFNDAILTFANLEGANLEGAYLTSADFSYA